ncbi:hypothetical protein BC830DRAFT_1096091 [Chytriomyces sp. MP71]|nr:hypothetical protein BC830DRAFT_1096091 [Chytriomyces sp. MP71]
MSHAPPANAPPLMHAKGSTTSAFVQLGSLTVAASASASAERASARAYSPIISTNTNATNTNTNTNTSTGGGAVKRSDSRGSARSTRSNNRHFSPSKSEAPQPASPTTPSTQNTNQRMVRNSGSVASLSSVASASSASRGRSKLPVPLPTPHQQPPPPNYPPPNFLLQVPPKGLDQDDIALLANTSRVTLTHSTNLNLPAPRIIASNSNLTPSAGGGPVYRNNSASYKQQLPPRQAGGLSAPASFDSTYSDISFGGSNLELDIDQGLLENKFWKQNNLALLNLPVSGFTMRPSDSTENLEIEAPIPPSPMSINWITNSGTEEGFTFGNASPGADAALPMMPPALPSPSQKSTIVQLPPPPPLSPSPPPPPPPARTFMQTPVAEKKKNPFEFFASKFPSAFRRSSVLTSTSMTFTEKNASSDTNSSFFASRDAPAARSSSPIPFFRSRSPTSDVQSITRRSKTVGGPLPSERSSSFHTANDVDDDDVPLQRLTSASPALGKSAGSPALWRMSRTLSSGGSSTALDKDVARSQSPLLGGLVGRRTATAHMEESPDAASKAKNSALDSRSKSNPAGFRRTSLFDRSATPVSASPALAVGGNEEDEIEYVPPPASSMKKMVQRLSFLRSKSPTGQGPAEVPRRALSPIAKNAPAVSVAEATRGRRPGSADLKQPASEIQAPVQMPVRVAEPFVAAAEVVEQRGRPTENSRTSVAPKASFQLDEHTNLVAMYAVGHFALDKQASIQVPHTDLVIKANNLAAAGLSPVSEQSVDEDLVVKTSNSVPLRSLPTLQTSAVAPVTFPPLVADVKAYNPLVPAQNVAEATSAVPAYAPTLSAPVAHPTPGLAPVPIHALTSSVSATTRAVNLASEPTTVALLPSSSLGVVALPITDPAVVDVPPRGETVPVIALTVQPAPPVPAPIVRAPVIPTASISTGTLPGSFEYVSDAESGRVPAVVEPFVVPVGVSIHAHESASTSTSSFVSSIVDGILDVVHHNVAVVRPIAIENDPPAAVGKELPTEARHEIPATVEKEIPTDVDRELPDAMNKELPASTEKILPPVTKELPSPIVIKQMLSLAPVAEVLHKHTVPIDKELPAMTNKDLPPVKSSAPIGLGLEPPVPSKDSPYLADSPRPVPPMKDIAILPESSIVVNQSHVKVTNAAALLRKDTAPASDYSFADSEEFEVHFVRSSSLANKVSSSNLATGTEVVILESDDAASEMVVTVIQQDESREVNRGEAVLDQDSLTESRVLVNVPGVKITEIVAVTEQSPELTVGEAPVYESNTVEASSFLPAASILLQSGQDSTVDNLKIEDVDIDVFEDAESHSATVSFKSPVSVPTSDSSQPQNGGFFTNLASMASKAITALEEELFDLLETPKVTDTSILEKAIAVSEGSKDVLTTTDSVQAPTEQRKAPFSSTDAVVEAGVVLTSAAETSTASSELAPTLQNGMVAEPLSDDISSAVIIEDTSARVRTKSVSFSPKLSTIHTFEVSSADEIGQVEKGAVPVNEVELERSEIVYDQAIGSIDVNTSNPLVGLALTETPSSGAEAVILQIRSQESVTVEEAIGAIVIPQVDAIFEEIGHPDVKVTEVKSRDLQQVVAESDTATTVITLTTAMDDVLPDKPHAALIVTTAEHLPENAVPVSEVGVQSKSLVSTAIATESRDIVESAPVAISINGLVENEPAASATVHVATMIEHAISDEATATPVTLAAGGSPSSACNSVPPTVEAISSISSAPANETREAVSTPQSTAKETIKSAAVQGKAVVSIAESEEELTAVEESVADVSFSILEDEVKEETSTESGDKNAVDVQAPSGLIAEHLKNVPPPSMMDASMGMPGMMPGMAMVPPPPPSLYGNAAATSVGFYGTPEQVYQQQMAYYQQMQYYAQQWQQQQQLSQKQLNRMSSEFSSSASDIASMHGIQPSDSASNYGDKKSKNRPISVYSMSTYQAPATDAWSQYFAKRPTFKNQRRNSWTPKRKSEVHQHLIGLRGNVQRGVYGQERSSNRALLDFSRFCIQDSMVLDVPEREELLDEAFEILKRLCLQGNAEAQYLMGSGYYDDSSYETAYLLLYNAAIQKHGAACGKVAAMVASGKGTERDDAMAVSFYKKGFKYGDLDSAFKLGQAYAYGKLGVTVNFTEALRLLNECAKDTTSDVRPKALFEISRIYEIGSNTVTVNNGIALSALNDAAKGGYAPAITKIAECYQQGKFGLRLDERKAKSLFRTAAELGDARARDALASYLR